MYKFMLKHLICKWLINVGCEDDWQLKHLEQINNLVEMLNELIEEIIGKKEE